MALTLANYLQQELKRRGWSRRTLAMYAEISPDTVARATRGDSIPDTDSIRKMAEALEVDEVMLLRLAGHLEDRPRQLQDAGVINFALRLEELPEDRRRVILEAMEANLDAFNRLNEAEALIAEVRRRFPDLAEQVDQRLARNGQAGSVADGDEGASRRE